MTLCRQPGSHAAANRLKARGQAGTQAVAGVPAGRCCLHTCGQPPDAGLPGHATSQGPAGAGGSGVCAARAQRAAACVQARWADPTAAGGGGGLPEAGCRGGSRGGSGRGGRGGCAAWWARGRRCSGRLGGARGGRAAGRSPAGAAAAAAVTRWQLLLPALQCTTCVLDVLRRRCIYFCKCWQAWHWPKNQELGAVFASRLQGGTEGGDGRSAAGPTECRHGAIDPSTPILLTFEGSRAQITVNRTPFKPSSQETVLVQPPCRTTSIHHTTLCLKDGSVIPWYWLVSGREGQNCVWAVPSLLAPWRAHPPRPLPQRSLAS